MAHRHAGPARCPEAMLPPQALDPEAIIAVQAAVIAELRAANGALRTQVAVMDGLIDDFTVMVRAH